MITKSALLKRANEELPEHWQFLRETNPQMRLPVIERFPTVTRMTIGEISHMHGTEADLTLEVTQEKGDPLQLKGVSLENHWDSTCEFMTEPKELKQFAEVFACHLIFNLFCDERIKIDAWQSLPE